jgi:hypothetical protein
MAFIGRCRIVAEVEPMMALARGSETQLATLVPGLLASDFVLKKSLT